MSELMNPSGPEVLRACEIAPQGVGVYTWLTLKRLNEPLRTGERVLKDPRWTTPTLAEQEARAEELRKGLLALDESLNKAIEEWERDAAEATKIAERLAVEARTVALMPAAGEKTHA